MSDNQTNTKPDTVVARTKSWLTESVIKHQFCPYAKQPYQQGIIGYEVYTGSDPIELLEMLARCCIALDTLPPTELETTLLIASGTDKFPNDFYDYLDVLDAANALLDNPKKFLLRFSDDFQQYHTKDTPKNWSDEYQIASFHPDYVFEGAGENDRENYTNRSPYPIFHLLRNASIDKVRMDDDKAERIVERNIKCLHEMSNDQFLRLRLLTHT